jgi:DNA polymerase-3 subunit gamma/tau
MSYHTLYRKYRSMDLTELKGQSHIIKTITNALANNRLAHAYIFSGPRGTGKTSTARILAKMVNATQDDMANCPICQKIAAGTCIDVIEMDAASHTGVDTIRQLIDQIQFLPVEASRKVFIIDEVHMLSAGAFNALLKTLEEPPAHALFVLATTALHKIPATIQSRAQVLHFRLLTPQQITDHLAHIVAAEGATIDAGALQKIATVANGGMRDALSLLDQVMSMATDKAITAADVSLVLGTANYDELNQFIATCLDNNPQAFSYLRDLLDAGSDIFQLYADCVDVLYQRLVGNTANVEMVSWLAWFIDELSRLKMGALPQLSAQVALYKRLQEGGVAGSTPAVSPAMTAPPTPLPAYDASPVRTASPVHSVPVRTVNPVAMPAPQPAASSKNDSVPVPPSTLSHTKETTPPPKTAPSAPKPSLVSAMDHNAMQQIIAQVGGEFPLLKPIITDATLMVQGHYLCLVIEPTYHFFQKKLREDGFKHRFLTRYNAIHNTALSDWVVVTDVNEVYALPVASTAATQAPASTEVTDTLQTPMPPSSIPLSTESDPAVSALSATESAGPPPVPAVTTENPSPPSCKTVNQIVEMFEGHVIQ